MDELKIDLVYVGQLEQYLHPDGAEKFAAMAAQGMLTPVFSSERVTIYVVPGRLQQDVQGFWAPAASADEALAPG
jgi:hypothetical protein